MARAAFVMDRLMRSVGLPGKSFIPLIVGFGCNVPAIMATRTLENRRDRILTVMMAPFMSCGARLPVYALFAAAFFPTGGQNLVFALYLIGIGFAVMTGLMLKSTLLKGETTPFVMELPPYHLPTLQGVLLRTWDRLKQFLFRAGRVIVAGRLSCSSFFTLGTDGSFGNENTDRSVLADVGKAMTPVLAPMGISEDNWPATVGMITGIFAKEAVVGTLNALYGALAEDAAARHEAKARRFDLLGGIAGGVRHHSRQPCRARRIDAPIRSGLNIVETGDLAGGGGRAGGRRRHLRRDGEPLRRADRRLRLPAGGAAVHAVRRAIAAIYRETGPRWAIFASLWTTGLGYGAAVVAYQAGTFGRDPATAAAWIAGILRAVRGALLALRMAGEARPAAAVRRGGGVGDDPRRSARLPGDARPGAAHRSRGRFDVDRRRPRDARALDPQGPGAPDRCRRTRLRRLLRLRRQAPRGLRVGGRGSASLMSKTACMRL